MNMANDGAKYGFDQYRFAHNFDLKNKTLVITGSANKYTLKFEGKEKLTFDSGAEAGSFCYECLKIEADTYFVFFGGNIAAIDLEYCLATLVLPEGYVFGSIELPGKMSSGNLHKLTDDMVGTSVRWTLGCDRYVDRIYFSPDACRDAWSLEGGCFTDHSIKCVKIKDGIYLTDVAGQIPKGVCSSGEGSRMIALEDYEHMMLVGCIFCEEPKMISGYGEFPEFDMTLLT